MAATGPMMFDCQTLMARSSARHAERRNNGRQGDGSVGYSHRGRRFERAPSARQRLLRQFGDKYLERKQSEAAEILIEEVSKGSPEPINFTESDTDPLIEIIYRFSKAAADGEFK